ncbi:hypothetical protein Pgy4_41894, partial [Pseudomonas savastanoi pv. glycinea str. race 4]
SVQSKKVDVRLIAATHSSGRSNSTGNGVPGSLA